MSGARVPLGDATPGSNNFVLGGSRGGWRRRGALSVHRFRRERLDNFLEARIAAVRPQSWTRQRASLQIGPSLSSSAGVMIHWLSTDQLIRAELS